MNNFLKTFFRGAGVGVGVGAREAWVGGGAGGGAGGGEEAQGLLVRLPPAWAPTHRRRTSSQHYYDMGCIPIVLTLTLALALPSRCDLEEEEPHLHTMLIVHKLP